MIATWPHVHITIVLDLACTSLDSAKLVIWRGEGRGGEGRGGEGKLDPQEQHVQNVSLK